MFDSVTYISLETQSDNEIGQISRILYHYGKYIVTDMLTNRVFIFNEDGKYYSKIDAIGNGPEEYVQITDITIDKYNERIKVLDAMQGKIVSYDLEGYSVGETKLPVVPAPLHFCQVEKEKYALLLCDIDLCGWCRGRGGYEQGYWAAFYMDSRGSAGGGICTYVCQGRMRVNRLFSKECYLESR